MTSAETIIAFRAVPLVLPDEKICTVEYALIRADLGSRFAFSVAVRLRSPDGVLDSARVDDLSSVYDTARAVFDAVVAGSVTPCTLRDVAYDLIG